MHTHTTKQPPSHNQRRPEYLPDDAPDEVQTVWTVQEQEDAMEQRVIDYKQTQVAYFKNSNFCCENDFR